MKPSLNTYEILIEAPFGAVGVRAQGEVVTEIALLPPALARSAKSLNAHHGFTAQIQAYLKNPCARFNIKHEVAGTAYQRIVWQAISAIPCGETRTYAELAQQIGSGPRAVANACGANPFPLVVPCHRVLAKNGLGGFMQRFEGGLEIKKWLLAHETQ
jgi:methylated-DNA-[protein]-cysteine S-methyltransferase